MWTLNKPIHPGWYFLKNYRARWMRYASKRETVARIDVDGSLTLWDGTFYPTVDDIPIGEWYGPLAVPD